MHLLQVSFFLIGTQFLTNASACNSTNNEQSYFCVNCRRTCQTPPKAENEGPIKGCGCIDGYIKDERTDECVKLGQAPEECNITEEDYNYGFIFDESIYSNGNFTSTETAQEATTVNDNIKITIQDGTTVTTSVSNDKTFQENYTDSDGIDMNDMSSKELNNSTTTESALISTVAAEESTIFFPEASITGVVIADTVVNADDINTDNSTLTERSTVTTIQSNINSTSTALESTTQKAISVTDNLITSTEITTGNGTREEESSEEEDCEACDDNNEENESDSKVTNNDNGSQESEEDGDEKEENVDSSEEDLNEDSETGSDDENNGDDNETNENRNQDKDTAGNECGDCEEADNKEVEKDKVVKNLEDQVRKEKTDDGDKKDSKNKDDADKKENVEENVTEQKGQASGSDSGETENKSIDYNKENEKSTDKSIATKVLTSYKNGENDGETGTADGKQLNFKSLFKNL